MTRRVTLRVSPGCGPGPGPWSLSISPRYLTVVVLTVAVLLRLTLALINRDSNDDHIEVVTRILTEKRLPHFGECTECFHPKLYHLTVAAVAAVLPAPSPTQLIVTGQLLNVAAGLGTLWIVALFLRRFVPDPTTRAMAFALTALNPELASINGMATNDSFVILWSTMAVYGALRFLETTRLGHLALGAVGTVLAGLSKGNGLVTATVLVGALVVWAILRLQVRSLDARWLAVCAAAFCLVWVAIVPWAGQYLDNARRSGSPFAVRFPPAPRPHLFEETYIGRAGVTSIVHAYLTFRIVDLIQHPISNFGPMPQYRHRTSLWSQLYGRAHFAHFADWPRTWSTIFKKRDDWVHPPFIRRIGRAIMLLALAPTTLMVLGGALRLGEWLRWLLDPQRFRRQSPTWVLDVAAATFLAFIVVYTLRYRDYTFMKAVFLLPGLLGFVHWFVVGYTVVRGYAGASGGIVGALNGVLLVLLALYAADLTTLVLHLAIRL